MAHYFMFLQLVNQCLFFLIACIFSKLFKIESEGRYFKNPNFSQFDTILVPVLAWIVIKYKHHFKFSILFESVVTIFSPLTYFYNLIKPGRSVGVLCNHTYTYEMFLFSPGVLDLPFIHQWQETLNIFWAASLCLNVMLILLNFARDNLDWTLPMIGTLSMMLVLPTVIRRYLQQYVHLDQIKEKNYEV